MDKQLITDCADLVIAAYSFADGESYSIVEGHNIVAELSAKTGRLFGREKFGFITMKGSDMFISLRGTDSIGDWKVNAELRLNSLGLHDGFYDLSGRLIDQIVNQIPVRRPSSIVLTGHSLGAALATILANLLHRYLKCRVELITFASPRVGRSGAISEDLPHTRIVNTEDVVPTVPFPGTFQHFHNAVTFTSNAGDIAENHSMKLYREKINDL